MLISLAALLWTIYHDPLKSHLDKYDFTTPKGCLLSTIQLELNNDIGTSLALKRLFSQRTLEEKLRTIAIHKEAEWRDKKILFVSYEENGIKKYDTEAFTKDAQTGFWEPSYVGFLIADEEQAPFHDDGYVEEKGRLE